VWTPAWLSRLATIAARRRRRPSGPGSPLADALRLAMRSARDKPHRRPGQPLRPAVSMTDADSGREDSEAVRQQLGIAVHQRHTGA